MPENFYRLVKVLATLEMTVHYESILTEREIEELLDKAREYGEVVKAEYTVHRACTKSLL